MKNFFSGIRNFENKLNENREKFTELEKEFTHLVFDEVDDAESAGWIHDFFCDECFSPLKKDGERIVCTHCGKDFTNVDRKRKAAKMDLRYRISEALVFGSFMVNLGKEEWKEGIERVLNFYSDLSENSSKGGRTPGERPVLSSQLLNDAMLLMNFAVALMFAGFSKNVLNLWKERIFDRIVEGLKSRRLGAHNHDVWILSAMGLKSLIFEEKDVENHLKKLEEISERSFLKNGFWYEGSIHYHFYALEGFVKFYLPYIVKTGKRSKILDENLKRALKAQLFTIFPDGRFPNPGDGWPRIGLNSYTDILEYGAQIFDDDLIKRELCYARSGDLSGEDLPIYGRRVSKGVYPEFFYFDNECPSMDIDLPEEYFGPGESVIVRKKGWTVFLKSGQASSSHIHEDLCSFEVYLGKTPIFVDLSNTGYGIPEMKKWFSKGLAHNTIFINGKSEKFIGPMRTHKFKGKIGCSMNKNPFGYEFLRTIDIENDSLVIESSFKKEGDRLGMSFVIPYEVDLSGSIDGPDVEASEYVRWSQKSSDEFSLNFEKFKLKLRSDGVIYLGESFWIPKGRRVLVIYTESENSLYIKVEVIRR